VYAFDINFYCCPKEIGISKVFQAAKFTFGIDTAFFFFSFPIADNLNNVLKYFLNNVIYLEYLITLCFSLRIISFEIRPIINANLLGKKIL